jgi:hypothetical protein
VAWLILRVCDSFLEDAKHKIMNTDRPRRATTDITRLVLQPHPIHHACNDEQTLYYQIPTYQWGIKQVRLPDHQITPNSRLNVSFLLLTLIPEISNFDHTDYVSATSHVFMVRTRTLFTTFCDDDTLILHANSGRGSPQCRNNYTLFIFSLISNSFIRI